MKKINQFFLCFLFSAGAFAQSDINKTSISIIPQPVSVTEKTGSFKLPENISVYANDATVLKQSVDVFSKKITTATGKKITLSKSDGKSTVKFVLNSSNEAQLGNEGYKISVNNNQITVSANTPQGVFYGVQTLFQLFPAEIEGKEIAKNITWEIPNIEITDYPKLAWRGLMFDVSRHFFTKDEVKKYIDNMVRYKYNMLHWHLTDDEGWRIEIKGLPKLTEIGAWNVKRTGNFGNFIPTTPDEPRNYGGYYTQEDIKEIVQYAKERFVNIMPEIDVPGHSLAAIASYPELSCTADAVNYKVRSGEQIMDWSHGAPPLALVDNSLCPASEKVYAFLDTVITQVAALFPFEYIHMGGDEAAHNFWEKDEKIKQLMKQEGLKTIPQVQAYFEKRVEQIVVSKGKKFMGWDEILEGGVTPSASVMSWRGMKHGIKASNEKHNVVMSPTDFAYFDYMQGDEATEPKIYASLRLNKVYQFEPVPAEANANYILGGQANLWTEQVYNFRQVEYMTWPRGFAMSESLWSPSAKKNWNNFISRTEDHFKRLELAEIKYSPAMYDPIITVKSNANKELIVTLTPEIEGLDLYYSFDNSGPDNFYPKYTAELTVPKDANMLRVITYKGKKVMGRMISIPVTDLAKRVK